MATLKFKYTVNGQGCLRGKLALQCSVKGTSIRHYLIMGDFLNPFNLEDWNEDKGKFIDGENVVLNNSVMAEVLRDCLQLSENFCFNDGKELYDYYKDLRQARNVHIPTFIEWLDIFIVKEKSKSIGKSSNYQLFVTLKHKLQGVDLKSNKSFPAPVCNGKLIGDYLITEIDTTCFRTFCNWVLEDLKGRGFKNLCTSFIGALTKMQEQYPTLHFPEVRTSGWRSLIPKKKRLSDCLTAKQKLSAVSESIPVLTLKEIEKIENMDLNLVKANANRRNLTLLELYRDFALLVYYLSSRPADVLQLHSVRNFSTEESKIIYVPYKLRNRGGKAAIIDLNQDMANSRIVKKMNEKALAIINKYEGQSKGGYLLPFPINDKDWGIIDGDDYAIWETHRNDTLQQVNAVLKKISLALKLSVKSLTLYTFRHSSITHAINGGENWGTIAYRAGTSVKMIENHYYNPVK